MEKEEIRRKLKKLIRKLEKIRGRHTELVSVYIPAGSNLVDIINQLREELSTAENIKSKTTRKNVTGALEKILQYLKLFRKTPPNGLVIFCGNVSPIEGKTEMKLWSIEPPEPLDTKIYWCDQVFVLEPLKEMVAEKDIYGLIVLDTREADIGILKGKKVRLLKKIESMVPSKTIKGGMCVAEDSLIQLEDGKIIQIKELSNNSKILVYSFKKFKPLFSNSFELYKRRAKIAYKILLEEPSNSIVLTPEHLVFVVGKNGIEEKYVEEIKKGDFLLMLRNFRINSGLKITKDLAQLLGYILGDGTLDNNRIILYDKDPDLIKRYKKIVKRLLKKEPKILKRRNTYELRIYKKFDEFLIKKYPELLQKSRERDIPQPILMLKDKELCAFLRGLFDAEGYVSREGIGMRMSSQLVMRKLQLILLRFGIVSSLRGPDKLKRFEIRITNPQFIKSFAKYIGFSSQEKMKKLRKILRDFKSGRSIRVPIHGKFARKIIEEVGLKKENLEPYGMFLVGKRCISYPVFMNFVEEMKNLAKKDIKIFKKLLRSNLIAVRVKEKRKIRAKGYFYDLYVPKYNTFVVNGIVVHNSQVRYDRIREQAIQEFLTKVGEIASKIFLQEEKLKGVIIGGPGPIKERFASGDYLNYRIREKVLGIKDTSYTGEYGLQELVRRSEDLLKEASIIEERKVLERFFKEIRSNGNVVYGVKNTLKALELGAVDTILISDGLELKRIILECPLKHEKIIIGDKEILEEKCDVCGNIMRVKKVEELEDYVVEKAKEFSTEVKFISVDTPEGKQFKSLSGIGAILRFKVD